MDVPVYDTTGKQVGTLAVDENTLGPEINHALIKQAYVRYHANNRQGSARTKSRGMVDGSTRKLYKQKGTGRARMGNNRTVIRRGGGVAFAKTRTHEDFRKEMPIKMRRKANRNALLAKLIDNEVKVIDSLEFKDHKTRNIVSLLDAIGIDRTCLMALDPQNANARRAAGNVEGLDVCPSHELTCFNMLNHRYLVIGKDALEAWLSGASSKTDKSAKTHRQMAGEGA
ncbi:MAG: 50S ribosomal protein L4 [Planctomycetota bacterium]|jgi:large subunit ribosomal protein L4